MRQASAPPRSPRGWASTARCATTPPRAPASRAATPSGGTSTPRTARPPSRSCRPSSPSAPPPSPCATSRSREGRGQGQGARPPVPSPGQGVGPSAPGVQGCGIGGCTDELRGRPGEAWPMTLTAVFRAATGVLALYVADDRFLQPQPGTSAGDHLVSGLVPLALLALAFWAFPRLKGGAQGALATTLGVLALAGAVEGVYYARELGPSGD